MLVAIYIEEHFLFDEAQIINLGGRFIYSLKDGIISKTDNELYIHNFYSEGVILSLSAIVGKNGAGKSSLLDLVTEIINKSYGYRFVLIFEDSDKVLVHTNTNVKFDFEHEIFSGIFTTFYYSPYLDFKNEKNGQDLSLDNIIEKDLDNINDIRKSSEKVNPLQQLKMRNWIRQMEFINSDIGQEFSEIFDLPTSNLNKITFTRYLIEVDREKDEIEFHNTPMGFREIIQFIYNKTRKEAEDINKNRPKGFSLVKLQKDLLKNYFLMDFLCLFIIQMEKENKYLQEGFIDNTTEFIKNNKEKSALESFFNFLEEHYYKIGESKRFGLLPVEETKKLIQAIYLYIDDAEAVDDHDITNFNWSEKAIYLDQEKSIELLELQNDFLNKVEGYYENTSKTLNDLEFQKDSRIRDFINFQPSNRSLSSGENSLLNLFSRFHDILKKDFSKLNPKEISPLNFILLDEADLGFHPKWKKQFVSTILYFFDVYFSELKSNVQIIFTTHDPLTLSDILNYNVVYLDKSSGQVVMNNEIKPNFSFGANITDLLADSFFVGDGLIGDFARNKIQQIIDCLNDVKIIPKINWIQNPEDIRKLIKLIGEPFLRDKLNDMFLEVFPEYKADEIKRLEEKIKELKK